MNKYLFPLAVIATMFVADYASGKGQPQGPRGGMPASSHAAANSNGIRSLDRDHGLDRAAERRNAHSLGHGKSVKRKPAKAPRLASTR